MRENKEVEVLLEGLEQEVMMQIRKIISLKTKVATKIRNRKILTIPERKNLEVKEDWVEDLEEESFKRLVFDVENRDIKCITTLAIKK